MTPLEMAILLFAAASPAQLPPSADVLSPDMHIGDTAAAPRRRRGGHPGGHARPPRPGAGSGGSHARPPHPGGGPGGHSRPPVRGHSHSNINHHYDGGHHGPGHDHHHYHHHDHWDDHWDDHWHPLRTATTVAVTAAVVGSIVRSLPPECSTVVVNEVSYSQCGSTWYEPRYAGSSIQYVVVNPPR
jgi:hypothetical protein